MFRFPLLQDDRRVTDFLLRMEHIRRSSRLLCESQRASYESCFLDIGHGPCITLSARFSLSHATLASRLILLICVEETKSEVVRLAFQRRRSLMLVSCSPDGEVVADGELSCSEIV